METKSADAVLSIQQIQCCFGELSDPESARIFSTTAGQLLKALDGRLSHLKDVILEGDPDQIMFQAHQLKGSFSTMGSESLAALCDQLEHQAKTLTPEELWGFNKVIESQAQEFKTELNRILESLT